MRTNRGLLHPTRNLRRSRLRLSPRGTQLHSGPRSRIKRCPVLREHLRCSNHQPRAVGRQHRTLRSTIDEQRLRRLQREHELRRHIGRLHDDVFLHADRGHRVAKIDVLPHITVGDDVRSVARPDFRQHCHARLDQRRKDDAVSIAHDLDPANAAQRAEARHPRVRSGTEPPLLAVSNNRRINRLEPALTSVEVPRLRVLGPRERPVSVQPHIGSRRALRGDLLDTLCELLSWNLHRGRRRRDRRTINDAFGELRHQLGCRP